MRRNILAFCTVLLLIFIAACEKQATEPKVGNPTITILTPSEGQELYGIVNVEVFGHDVEGHGLDRIVFYVGDAAQYTDPNPSSSSPSSTWQWNSELVSDGEYDLKVVAYDHVGRSTEAARRHVVSNADAASGVIRSNESGMILTRKGASIRVPLGGVPLDEDGENATMVFSIARDTSANAPPPSGETRVSQYYRFTPGGFVFRYPVEVTLPLIDGVDVEGREVNLYRINPTTGELENFAGTYNEEFETISAQTYELYVVCNGAFECRCGSAGVELYQRFERRRRLGFIVCRELFVGIPDSRSVIRSGARYECRLRAHAVWLGRVGPLVLAARSIHDLHAAAWRQWSVGKAVANHHAESTCGKNVGWRSDVCRGMGGLCDGRNR